MDATSLTSAAALATALSSIIFTYVKIRNERTQWKKAIEDQRYQWEKEHDAELKSKFLTDLVKERYRTYPAVLKILGNVRDIPDPNEEHWKSLGEHPEQLITTSNSLIEHLYGEAGLVMSIKTRNKLLSAYYACHLFQAKKITIEQLVREFFDARRELRYDLQLEDVGEKSELSKIRENFL